MAKLKNVKPFVPSGIEIKSRILNVIRGDSKDYIIYSGHLEKGKTHAIL